MKSFEQVLKEGNSTTNQIIKGKFVAQHVVTNMNTVTEYILSKSYEDENAPFSYDEIENMYILPELKGEHVNFEGGTDDDRNDEIERLEALRDTLDENNDDQYDDYIKIDEEIDELNDLESEPQEILEWWEVSSFLCEKLKELGHPVLDNENLWGRCTSGQAILLDYDITVICANMGILDGQESSWAK